MDEKLKLAGQLYGKGYTCSQAVFCVFAKELKLEEETAYRMMEGFGEGFGALQETCGAFSAIVAVISYFISSGSTDASSRERTYQAVQHAAEIFRKEYGSLCCKEILHGRATGDFPCGMKVKDAVLLIRKIRMDSCAQGGMQKAGEGENEAGCK